jgi:hypothetical protein
MTDRLEIEPLLTEVEAARRLGIDWKWLRSERYKGRITFKRVAGHVMYRTADIVAWQKRGTACQEEDPAAAPSSSASSNQGGRSRSTTSSGATETRQSDVQRARASFKRLKGSSRAGSKTTKPNNADGPSAPVIPMKRP